MTQLGAGIVRTVRRADQRDGALRVTFLTPTPSPYTQDLFAAMARDGRITPRVLYLEKHAPAFNWTDPELPVYSEILPGGWFSLLGARIHANPGAIARIRESRPDVVVVAGYSGLTNQAVMWWLKATRTPWVFYGEIPGYQRRGRIGSVLRSAARWPAVKWSSAIAAVGSRAAAAYRALAPCGRPVANIPYFCDMSAFAAVSQAPEPDRPLRLLYCGQMVHRKGVDLLVKAFARLVRQHPNVRLKMVGDGELMTDLRAGLPDGVRERVEFTGFLQVSELPAQFADADAFVLPSRHDGWGVVVNQALAAGLPIVCSDAVGAAVDTVVPGENGMIVPSGDEDALFRAFAELAADREKVNRFAERSRALAADWLPERGVDRWHDLFLTVLRRKRVRV
jgi:glycosyltransferase involved in cell wall biosynthesis